MIGREGTSFNDDDSYMEVQKVKSGFESDNMGSFVIKEDTYSNSSAGITETGIIQLRNPKKNTQESDWASEADYEDFRRAPLDESFQSETSVHRETPDLSFAESAKP